MHAERSRKYRARQQRVTDHGLTKSDLEGMLPRSDVDAVASASSFNRGPPTPPLCHFCRRPTSAFVRLSALRPERQRGRKGQFYGIGRVHNDARGRLTFVYDDEWRKSLDAYSLSLSMPLAAKEHGPSVIQAFLWGLLPDNELVLSRLRTKFQVSARNVFALISYVGEDCAGAVQFITTERLKAIKSAKEDKVEWLSESDVAKRLQMLRDDHAAWRLPRDTGQFSLAGAQPKTALLLQKKALGHSIRSHTDDRYSEVADWTF